MHMGTSYQVAVEKQYIKSNPGGSIKIMHPFTLK